MSERKTAVVTGASRGIGKAVALELARAGYDIAAICASRIEAAEEVCEACRALGAEARAYRCDVSDSAAVKETAGAVRRDFGAVHVLVNNAGITRDNLLLRMSPADWDAVIQTNLRSVFNYCKAFAPMMIKQRSGSIVNISSIVAINGNAGQCNYAAAKAGIIGFTRSLAKELGGRNIRCNAVAPGFIETPMTQQLSEEARKNWMAQIPLKRGGTDLDVARVSLFLASDLAGYVTGHVLCCDGGLVL